MPKIVTKAKAIVTYLVVNDSLFGMGFREFHIHLASTGRFNMKDMRLLAGKTVKITLEEIDA